MRLFSLIRKEFLAIWRDKKSRFVLIAPPILQLFIFASAATLDVFNVSLGILNRDNGERGIELTERFYATKIFTHLTFLKSVEEIAPFINEQKGMGVVSIDESFSRNLDKGEAADIELIMDGRRTNSAQIVVGYITDIVGKYGQEIAKTAKIELFPRYWFNPNLLYYWFTLPGLFGILIMVEAVMLTAISIAREKELGTFEQLIVSPLLPMEILLGKAIPALVIGAIEGTFILLVSVWVFGVPFIGSIPLLYFSMFIFMATVIGIGLFISSLCSTQQQSMLAGFIFMSPSVLLSGFATPIENMPELFQWITYLIPLRYFLIICRGIFLKDLPVDVILANIWPMTLIAFFTVTAAAFFFKKRLP